MSAIVTAWNPDGREELADPDRLVPFQAVACDGLVGNDSGPDTPCTFEGLVDVAIFNDTDEAIWYCPDGHENHEPMERFS